MMKVQSHKHQYQASDRFEMFAQGMPHTPMSGHHQNNDEQEPTRDALADVYNRSFRDTDSKRF